MYGIFTYIYHKRKLNIGIVIYPDAPCREYFTYISLECGHFAPNVDKYSLHGASGIPFPWMGLFFGAL